MSIRGLGIGELGIPVRERMLDIRQSAIDIRHWSFVIPVRARTGAILRYSLFKYLPARLGARGFKAGLR